MAFERIAVTVGGNGNYATIRWSDRPGWSITQLGSGDVRVNFPITFLSKDHYAIFCTPYAEDNATPSTLTPPRFGTPYGSQDSYVDVYIDNILQGFTLEIIGETA